MLNVFPKVNARRYYYLVSLFLITFIIVIWQSLAHFNFKSIDLPYSEIKPQIIELDLPVQDKGRGGLITVDVNDDGQKDFIITKPDHIAVYDHAGSKLWVKKVNIQVTKNAEGQGLPGLHGAGVQAFDIDGDQKTEVLYLTKDGTLNIVQGNNGKTKSSIEIESSPGTEGWEHLVVANFRGEGNQDLLLQASNAEGYKIGSYLAAYALDDLLKGVKPQPLWTRDDFFASPHHGARVADLDGDGKDEVLGGQVIAPDGEVLLQIPLPLNANNHHLDALFVADVRPDIPGLEVVALEEGGDNNIFLYNSNRLIWQVNYKRQEPQNAAVGDFDLKKPGLEVWARSRYKENQKPFVFDAQGKLIRNYKMERVAPEGWTASGVEVISTIDWTGERRQLAAAKERHEAGDVAIFDPITGQFLYKFSEKADRLYVADVSGDWREEVIVLNGNQLHIYSNPEANPNPNRPSLWTQNHYRRSKMSWNYYSP